MEIGKLYSAKKWQWLILPEKELYKKLTDAYYPGFPAIDFSVNADSNKLNCKVTYLEPNNIFVCLGQYSRFCKKILTTNGELGWIIFSESCKEDIEEVKTE